MTTIQPGTSAPQVPDGLHPAAYLPDPEFDRAFAVDHLRLLTLSERRSVKIERTQLMYLIAKHGDPVKVLDEIVAMFTTEQDG